MVVGAAGPVEIGHSSIPCLIAAPTIRVPVMLRDSPNISRGNVGIALAVRLRA